MFILEGVKVMQEQFIHINTDGDKRYYKDREMKILHREDGPAFEFSDGTKRWFLNGANYTEKEWKIEVAKLKEPSCSGKIVEIDGKKYKLTEVM